MYIITQISAGGSEQLGIKCTGPARHAEDGNASYEIKTIEDLIGPILRVAKEFLAIDDGYHVYPSTDVTIFATAAVTQDHIDKKYADKVNFIVPIADDKLYGDSYGLSVGEDNGWFSIEDQVARYELHVFYEDDEGEEGWLTVMYSVSEF